jgi:tetratricopeptide (TPR) repeat protein
MTVVTKPSSSEVLERATRKVPILLVATLWWLPVTAQTSMSTLNHCFGPQDSAVAAVAACELVLKESAINSDTRAGVYNQLGLAFAREGEFESAIRAYSEALGLRRDFAAPLINRGAVYAQLHQFQKAMDDLTAAIALNPHAGELGAAYFNRARLYMNGRQYIEAMEDFNRAIASDPSNYQAYNERCWIRAIQNQELELALRDCDQAVALKPDYAAALNSRGFVRFRMGDYGAALSDYTAALIIQKKSASSLYVRGLAKTKTGDPTGGKADIAAAEALDPKIAETYGGYGVSLDQWNASVTGGK